jgi:tRNA/rRNA methyltransferase
VIPKGFSITLVEPVYPVNLGHIARLAKNFGVERLYLVKPKVDMAVAAVYASHAGDVLERAETVTFAQLRRRNQLLIATTAVRAKRRSNVIRRGVRPEQIAELVKAAETASLVLGRDTTGLTNEEVALCDVTVTLETGSRYRTLNVGHAAAVLLYLISRQPTPVGKPATRKSREIFAQSLHRLALDSGLQSHKVKDLLEVGRRMAATSRLTDRQLMMMSGIFRRAFQKLEAQGASKT